MFEKVIEFWFEEIDRSLWFKKDESFDALIRSRFSAIHTRAINGELFEWRTTSLGMLAEIIVLDQFSRNMYRGKPESFAYDLTALTLAQSAIARLADADLTTDQKSFMVMPFMHSESPLIHHQAVSLFTKLGVDATLIYERRHQAIIEKFGRYPHRNTILGRASTPDEVEFLSQPGSGF